MGSSDGPVSLTGAPAVNKKVAGFAHFLRSGLHGPRQLWPESEVQRILEQVRMGRAVVGHVGNV